MMPATTPTATNTGMLYAAVKNAPVWGGKVVSVGSAPSGTTAVVNLGDAAGEIVGLAEGRSVAEPEEPVFTLRSQGFAFLKKGSKRRDTGAWPDHDDGHIAVLR